MFAPRALLALAPPFAQTVTSPPAPVLPIRPLHLCPQGPSPLPTGALHLCPQGPSLAPSRALASLACSSTPLPIYCRLVPFLSSWCRSAHSAARSPSFGSQVTRFKLLMFKENINFRRRWWRKVIPCAPCTAGATRNPHTPRHPLLAPLGPSTHRPIGYCSSASARPKCGTTAHKLQHFSSLVLLRMCAAHGAQLK